MPRSDNTSFTNLGRSPGRLARHTRRLWRGLKHSSYREDVIAGLCLAAIVWLLFLLGGLMQP